MEQGATVRPFRFGVSISTAASRADWTAKARKVEDLGVDLLLVADHLTDALPPFPALASAAEATRRLRVGTLVLNNDLRHPVLVAREAAALDLLTEGRFELGLGAGHARAEYDEAGIPFDPAPRRVERLAEAVAVIKALRAGGPVSLDGRHYRVAGHTLWPRPSRLPLLIGGNNPALLRLAGREADIVGLTGFGERADGTKLLRGFTFEGTERRLDVVREAAGARYPDLELNALIQAVVPTADSRGSAEAQVGRLPGLLPDDVLRSPHLLIGTVEAMVDALGVRRHQLGISYYVIFEAALEAFAPVVARLAGK